MPGTFWNLMRVARIQTAAVEGGLLPVVAYLVGWSWQWLPLWALLGVLIHIGGFGMNSVSDVGYDRQDPHKQHHPLVTGVLSLTTAWRFVWVSQVASIAIFAYLAHVAIAPLAALGVFILFGYVYNLWGKRWKPGAVAAITLSFVFLNIAVMSTGSPTPLFWPIVLWTAAYLILQIGLQGELKEIGNPGEPNLLRSLGFRRQGTHFALSWAATLFLVVVVGLRMASVWWVAWHFQTLYEWVILVVAWFFLAFAVRNLVFRPIDHAAHLRVMGLTEAMWYVFMVLLLEPVLGVPLMILAVVLPVTWFVGWNRVLWSRSGSAFAPGV